MSILSDAMKKLQYTTAVKEEVLKIKELIAKSILDEKVNTAFSDFSRAAELTGLPEYNRFCFGEGWSWSIKQDSIVIHSADGFDSSVYITNYNDIKGKYLLLNDTANYNGYTIIDLTQTINPDNVSYILASKKLGVDVLTKSGIFVD